MIEVREPLGLFHDACQRPGKERAISYYSGPNKQTIIRPMVCNEHFRRMMEVDGPEWRWLTTLRLDMN
jgi:hypothetical protein